MKENNVEPGGMPGTVVELEAPELALAPPSMYRVMLHNDDYTSMEFVVLVLKKFFKLDHAKAISIMHEVHVKGVAVAGVYTLDIAETKVSQVTEFSRAHQFPLLCTVQKVE